MAGRITERFMSTLQELERSRDVESMASLFAEQAELRRIPQARSYRGPSGARLFFREYLHAFDDVVTVFHHLVEGRNSAVLEWTSFGRLPSGVRVRYEGCSVVEQDGERIKGFRTYYDASMVLHRRHLRDASAARGGVGVSRP